MSALDRIRTSNLRFRRPMAESPKTNEEKDLRIAAPSLGPQLATATCQTDPDSTAVIQAWDRLPEAVRAGIVAMVKAASGK
jgi:hypothetical protein